jgi:hypothetical protein
MYCDNAKDVNHTSGVQELVFVLVLTKIYALLDGSNLPVNE